MSDLTDDDAEEVIRQFAEITETDEAFAHFILQDVNFDLERALAHYYSADDPETAYKNFRRDNGDSGGTMSKSAGNEGKQPPRKRSRPADDPQNAAFPAELTLVSWNVDGRDERSLSKRFLAVLYIIARTNPEVIFLQEMTTELMPRLSELMSPMYNLVVSDTYNPQYFCVTLVSKNIRVTHSEVIPFSNTQMGRSMTVIQAQWQRLRLVLVNVHLESCREHGEVRKAQFKRCMEKIGTTVGSDAAETLAVFGGDLNIRDKEVAEVKADAAANLPEMRDAWEAAGSDGSLRFTWDMCRNDNYRDRGRARCRFDRVYFAGPYEDVEFNLEGTSRIRGPDCFPSDHFAIICRFVSPRNVQDQTANATSAARSSSTSTTTAATVAQMEN
uniref:5'-tyrosyl-DNA phosphodiesterase n=1 Tax=Globodera rostochiensis TaxID=31243 RepID=A0A914HQP4_GLORO